MGNGVRITRHYANGSSIEADSYAELLRMEREHDALNAAYLAAIKAQNLRPKTFLARLRQWSGR